jgi:adenine-specific DNA methylase
MVAQTAPRKKLIEVSIPLEAINNESAREKSIRHGHPSTLHLWWARRPLAACRAVLFAQLVDDPSACPGEFTTKAAQDAERDRLHKLIAALVPWEASNNETILNEARYEIARSVARGRGDELPPIGQIKPRQIIDYLQENAPPVYDPFSGGGSIPLEAQRLGLRAMGSDLNPVAVLIGKALIEFPPKFAGRKPVNPEVNELHQWKGAQALAEDVRYYGRWMREQAQRKIGHLYRKVVLAARHSHQHATGDPQRAVVEPAHEIVGCRRRSIAVGKSHPIGGQTAERHDVDKLGAGDGRERSVMRGHIVSECGRRAVLCLEIGRGEGEGIGPIPASRRSALR